MTDDLAARILAAIDKTEATPYGDVEFGLRRCATDRRLIDIAFEYAAKIDGEWGCVHSAEDIRSGLCPEQRPGELDIIITLVEGYGISPDTP